jgi:sialic acid synthase SpsE
MFPDMILGLSDHTPGHATVLGAVALGGRIIEKHFTDDTKRSGPDHAFSMDPRSWREMVDATRQLESALGNGIKRIEENERATVVLQRRAVRAARDLEPGTVLCREDLVVLRPCPPAALPASEIGTVIGKRMRVARRVEEHLSAHDVE